MKRKVTVGDCVQPLPPALSECKQIMLYIYIYIYKKYNIYILIWDQNLLKLIQYYKPVFIHKQNISLFSKQSKNCKQHNNNDNNNNNNNNNNINLETRKYWVDVQREIVLSLK